MRKSVSTKILAILFASAMTMGLNSCTSDDPISTDMGNNPYVPEYVSAGTQVDELMITDATIEDPVYIQNEMAPERVEMGLQFCEREPQFRFARIFRDLQLTPEQLDSIQVYMREHYDCQRIARAEYYNAVLEFVEEANAQRRMVLDSMHQGLIDRATAVQRLSQISGELRQAIANSGARETLRLALQDCTETLFANIRSILSEDQLEKWDQWVEDHNGPGPGPENGRGRGNGRG